MVSAIYSTQVRQSDQTGWYSDICLVCIRNPQPSGRWLVLTSKLSRIRLLAGLVINKARKLDFGIYENTSCIVIAASGGSLTARIVQKKRSFRYIILGTGERIDLIAHPI